MKGHCHLTIKEEKTQLTAVPSLSKLVKFDEARRQKFISSSNSAGIVYMRILNLVFHHILSVSYVGNRATECMYTNLLSRTFTAVVTTKAKWKILRKPRMQTGTYSIVCRFLCVVYLGSSASFRNGMGGETLAMNILAFYSAILCADVSKLSAQMALNGDTHAAPSKQPS